MKKIYVFIIAITIFSYIYFITQKTITHYQKHIQFISKEITGAVLLQYANKILIDTFATLYPSYKFKNDLFILKQKLQKEQFNESLKLLHTIVNLLEEETIFNYETILELEKQLFLEIANESDLILDPDLDTYYLMNFVINEYPLAFIRLKTLQQALDNNPVDEDKIAAIVEFQTTFQDLQNSFTFLQKYNPHLSQSLYNDIKIYTQASKKLLQFLQENIYKTYQTTQLLKRIEKQNFILFSKIRQKLIKKLNKKKHLYKEQIKNAKIELFILGVIILFITILFFLYEKTSQRNKYLAYHDQLTSLYNLHAFYRDVKETTPKGMLLIDIKKFSNINDFYGEKIGDLVLKYMAQLLLTLTKNYQCNIYRVSSDQFILVNYDTANNLCQTIAKQIFKKYTIPIEIFYKEKTYTINIKVRIAKICAHNTHGEAQEWKIKADMALNYAKKKGKNYITYDRSLLLEETIQNELAIVDMVQEAILENRVIPVFQKIAKNNEENSYECLMRIQEKNSFTLLPPAAFLDIIKPTPYYSQLTKIIIKKSFDYFASTNATFSINFSFSDITNKSSVTYLIKMIQNYNMQGRIIIELLEDESLKNMDVVKHFIQKMRKYDVKIAIDDFGSGYSNFHYLTQIQPDYIKIDGSLIKNIDTDEKSYITVKHIHNFAKEIGCKTIAEFVSSKEILNKVKAIGIDGYQGFYIAKPSKNISFE